MGLFILVVFVSSSLLLGLRAWARKDAPSQTDSDDVPLVVTLVVLLLLGGFLPAILHQYIRLPHTATIMTVLYSALAPWFAEWWLRRIRAKR